MFTSLVEYCPLPLCGMLFIVLLWNFVHSPDVEKCSAPYVDNIVHFPHADFCSSPDVEHCSLPDVEYC